MVQESLPDGYRGRVFSVYDFFYNIARLLAAGIAVALALRRWRGGTVAVPAPAGAPLVSPDDEVYAQRLAREIEEGR
jgi:hypothetical protein